MTGFFWAYLLIFLDFSINLNDTQSISLLPAFVGYLILVTTLKRMQQESEQFVRVRPWAIGMTIYSTLLYVMNLFGIGAGLPGGLLSLAGTVVSLYIAYGVISGIAEAEARLIPDGQRSADSLRRTWTVMAVCQCASYVSLLLPVIAVVLLLVNAAASIAFVVILYRTVTRLKSE